MPLLRLPDWRAAALAPKTHRIFTSFLAPGRIAVFHQRRTQIREYPLAG